MHHSMIVATAATSPPTLSGWGILVVLGILLVAARKKKAEGQQPTEKRPGRILRAVIRFYSGREMWGEPRSTATTFKPGKPIGGALPEDTAAMASVAITPPKVSLVKRQPSPWARAAARWITTYNGRAAGVLDRGVRAALWAARWAGKTWRALAPIVATIARTVRMWHCWPYALRGLARLALTATIAGLLVPAWRPYTLAALALTAVVVGVLAWRFQPKPPSDDEVYGPRLWVILREDLGLPEGEPRERWLHLPERLAAPDARIVLRLPWTFRGTEIERAQISDLINARLPGEWVGRYSATAEDYTAVYTRKPPAKPKKDPECPEMVDFFADDIQEAIASCKTGEVVLGKDQHGEIVIRRLDGETPHWALSVGSGGGKSTFNQMVAAQLIAQGYHIIVVDVKRSSVKPLEGIPGVHIYNDPKNPQDMRAAIGWFKDEIDARSYVKDKNPEVEFPGILLLIEEANEFADVSKQWWDENRKTKDDETGPKDRAADSIWGDVASAARLGRFVRGNILAVFQDLRDQALGGKGLRNLFRLKFMGNFTVNQWKNVIGTTPVPESVDKAGRMMLVEGNVNLWVQTLYGDGDKLRSWALERRAEAFDPAVGLFGTPPERSPEAVPYLVRLASRDKAGSAPLGASLRGVEHETAGRLSHDGADVTPLDGAVTGPRDRLRLIPGQGGQEAQEGPQSPAQDPTAPPELLPLAEVARRLQGAPGIPKYDTMRAHKSRRDDFPKPTVIGGKELYTETQISAYYTPRKNRA